MLYSICVPRGTYPRYPHPSVSATYPHPGGYPYEGLSYENEVFLKKNLG